MHEGMKRDGEAGCRFTVGQNLILEDMQGEASTIYKNVTFF